MFSKRLDAQVEAALAKSIKLRVKRSRRKKSIARKKRPMTSKLHDREPEDFSPVVLA